MNHTSFTELTHKRRSNRKFSPDVNVPAEVVESALQHAILSPNSSNMQLWEFYWVQTEALKEQLTKACLGQSAAKTADQMIVFVTRQDHWKRNAAWNRQRVAESIGTGTPNKLQQRGLDYYSKLMPILYRNDWLGISTLIRKAVCFFMGLNKPFMQLGGRADQRVMTHKSCALAAQSFMLSIVAAGYDCCPMEGFDARYVKKALKLPKRAEVNMIVSIGKGTPEGVWGERHRLGFDEVVFKR